MTNCTKCNLAVGLLGLSVALFLLEFIVRTRDLAPHLIENAGVYLTELKAALRKFWI